MESASRENEPFNFTFPKIAIIIPMLRQKIDIIIERRIESPETRSKIIGQLIKKLKKINKPSDAKRYDLNCFLRPCGDEAHSQPRLLSIVGMRMAALMPKITIIEKISLPA